jgi:hypothetical protein
VLILVGGLEPGPHRREGNKDMGWTQDPFTAWGQCSPGAETAERPAPARLPGSP